MAVKLLFVHALTSLHPGTGQGVGTIDLPIARERATNLPVLPGSALKGCLRASLDKDTGGKVYGGPEQQSLFRVSDARLLLLPVRCPATTFVWATSPYVLRRFARDCALAGMTNVPHGYPTLDSDGEAVVSDLSARTLVSGRHRLVLEDLDLSVKDKPETAWSDWIPKHLFPNDSDWRAEFDKRFAIVDDATFDYLCENATEVNAHIRIGDNGVVEDGALWYEESLPAECVLVAIVDNRQADIAWSRLVPPTLTVGGNETTGSGLARMQLAPEEVHD